jgi:alanine racemase
MPTDPFHASLSIDLDALAQNYHTLTKVAGGAEVAPVIKADAYGLGAVAVSRRLWAEGARRFFVARISEGEALRQGLGTNRPATIYVLDGAMPGSAPRLAASRLTPVLNSAAQVSEWAGLGRAQAQPLSAAIQIDTGMNRMGLRIDEAAALTQSMDAFKGLDIDLVMSHLACASEPSHPANAIQAQQFKEARALFPEAQASLANSGGIFLGHGYHHDLVRPGISLYGGGPFGVGHPDLATVATLTAPILQIRTVRPGETIGYGATFTASHAMRVAILGAGYADGVLRAFGSDGHAWFGGEKRKLLGRISMDMMAMELDEGHLAHPGDMAELLGPNMPVDAVAAASGTIAYECLVRVAPRLVRTYVGRAD